MPSHDAVLPAAAAAASGGPRPRRARAGLSDTAVTVLASVAIALPLVFYLHQHVRILRYGYEIESLQERRAALEERTRDLRAERMQAASLAIVESRAAALGLTVPEPSSTWFAGGAGAARSEPGAPQGGPRSSRLAAGGAADPGSIARIE